MIEKRIETEAFFNRSAKEVAPEIAERWYLAGQESTEALPGQAAFISISTKTETLEFRVLLVEAHSASTPGRIWKGKRLEELRALPPGSIKVYGSRAGIIPFIVAQGGDNLAIRALENITTKEKLKTATRVAKELGLKHSETGKLEMIDSTHFTYEKTAIS